MAAAIDPATYVERAMQTLGVTTPSALADVMGWRRGAERLIYRWLAGEVAPGFAYTIDLAVRCGWLTAAAQGSPVRLLPPPENRLPATLAADVAEILVRLAAQLDSVGAEVATIRQQLDRQERAVHPAAPAATHRPDEQA
jgi:hypothetical protein